VFVGRLLLNRKVASGAFNEACEVAGHTLESIEDKNRGYEMTTRVSPIGVDVERLEAELRPLQMDMIALALQGKQLHWNLQGRQFMSILMYLVTFVGVARSWAVVLAERLVSLGVWADGQPGDVARENRLEGLPGGAVSDSQALSLITERVSKLAGSVREVANNLGGVDIGSQDLCLDILRNLEKHAWMLRAQQA